MELLNGIPAMKLFNDYGLRELLATDSVALFPTLNDEENHKFTTFEPHLSVEETSHWINKTVETPVWAIVSPDNTAIGFVGYHSINIQEKFCMISYHLNKNFWGQGIVPASIMLTDNYIFRNTYISRISATVKPENTQSRRCLEKTGYKLEKIIDNYVSSAVNDKSRVRYYYSKKKSESCHEM